MNNLVFVNLQINNCINKTKLKHLKFTLLIINSKNITFKINN